MQLGVEELGKEKPTDSQLVVKRIALIVMEAERGKEVRLVHCWSQAKGLFLFHKVDSRISSLICQGKTNTPL